MILYNIKLGENRVYAETSESSEFESPFLYGEIFADWSWDELVRSRHKSKIFADNQIPITSQRLLQYKSAKTKYLNLNILYLPHRYGGARGQTGATELTRCINCDLKVKSFFFFILKIYRPWIFPFRGFFVNKRQELGENILVNIIILW